MAIDVKVSRKGKSQAAWKAIRMKGPRRQSTLLETRGAGFIAGMSGNLMDTRSGV